jgi:glycosyltransferase involved in cell wall biosynthesis
MINKSMQQINVLEVTNLFHSAEVFIGGQFLYLKKHGSNMHLICSPGNGLDNFCNKQQLTNYKAVEIKRQISFINDIVALIKICAFIKKNRINIIIGHQAKGRLLSVIAGKIMRVPKIIIFAHGAIFETATGLKRKILVWESKFESMCANKVVCVSNYIAKLRQEEKIDNKGKQIILGKGTCGGIDTQLKFNPYLIQELYQIDLKKKIDIDENDFVIGFCGRIVKDKGIIELIDAFYLLKEKHKHSQIKLLIVGDFEKRDSIPHKYIKYILDDPDIIFTGFVSEYIELYYSIMSVFILPSHREGFGMSVIEASAMQIPVMASKKTGCVETLLEGETGFYVDITPLSICENIEKLFNQTLRNQMGENGRKWVVNNFDHYKIWPKIDQLLKS